MDIKNLKHRFNHKIIVSTYTTRDLVGFILCVAAVSWGIVDHLTSSSAFMSWIG